MTRIFISHSHLDEEIADLLIDFLSESIEISKKEIRCTSDPNHGLDFSSSSISDQLKNDLNNAGALIIIATIDSLRSPWILFEVGSFWTTDKLVAPIIGPGLTFADLPGPLKGYRSIRIEDEDVSYQLNELINQLSRKLNLKQSGVTRRRDKKLEAFISHFRAWKSQLPVLDVSQQENIEDLQQKVEALEIRSRKEKQELEQSLQSQIRKLEQELRQARSQSNQAQEINVVSQREKEQLEQKIQEYKTQISQLEQELVRKRSQIAKQIKEIERLRLQKKTVMTAVSINRRNFLTWFFLGSSGLATVVIASKIFKEQPSTVRNNASISNASISNFETTRYVIRNEIYKPLLEEFNSKINDPEKLDIAIKMAIRETLDPEKKLDLQYGIAIEKEGLDIHDKQLVEDWIRAIYDYQQQNSEVSNGINVVGYLMPNGATNEPLRNDIKYNIDSKFMRTSPESLFQTF
ncbi:MAG: hypothetical protein AB4372_40080 [Xenococcus sp. (in: cyanobacteria)]